MIRDTSTVGSPGWWLIKLMANLNKVRPTYQVLDRYYCGDPPLASVYSQPVQDSYRRLQSMARMNYAELVVEAVRERMNPNGVLLDNGDDKDGAKLAWSYWQTNHLDADAMLVHRSMLSMGKAYAIVGLYDDKPLITPEDPREVITACDPIDRRTPIAALKVYRDPNYGSNIAKLFMPGVVYTAGGPDSNNVGDPSLVDVAASWNFTMQEDTLPGIVPVVEFTNNPNMFGKGSGEYERHLGVLDRIAYTILTRLEISTMQAFKQRGIKGVPDTDASGDEIDYSNVFKSDPGAMWLLPEGADIWESGQTDLNGILSSVKADVQDVAAVTRTPLFYLTPDAANGSAEGASLAREGLVFKTKDRIRQTSELWEQVVSLAFRFDGDSKRADNVAIEILWDDPERFTLSERFDAAAKAQSAGVPWETVMSTVLQYTPTQIEQMAALRASDALLTASLASPVQSVPGVSAGPPTATQPAQEPTAPEVPAV